jgi:hypothetical protein
MGLLSILIFSKAALFGIAKPAQAVQAGNEVIVKVAHNVQRSPTMA